MPDTTSTKKPPPPPPGLARDGRKDGPGRTLWKQIVTSGRYVLRPDELRTLEDACKTADLIAELEKEAEGRPRTVRGSTGQPVINPLLAEARQCRLALNQLLKQLKLPDDGDDNAAAGGERRSVGARTAAQSRWGKTG
jgi:hypothetical protein